MDITNTARKGIYVIGIITAIVVLLTACNDNTPQPIDNEPNLRALSSQELDIIQTSNDFSDRIFKRVVSEKPDENVFISPFSISAALSMTLNGAAGDTQTEIKEVLGIDDLTEDEINEAYKELVTLLLDMDNRVDLRIANSNWYKNLLTINPSFQDILKEYYDAEVNGVDFTDPDVKNEINGWIEDKTNGKIKNMIDKIPSNVLMYLINAIYFKADWKYEFDKSKTEEKPFYLDNGKTVDTEMMYAKSIKLRYRTHNDYAFVELPYGNGQFNMTVLLPLQDKGINEVLEEFSVEDLNAALEDTSSYTAGVYLPKFKINYKQKLNDILIDMGMGKAFSDDADFSNLFQEGVSAKISSVLHQSFLEVNEVGTEAAAATVVTIIETSINPSQPPVININRPFAFFIRERHSNAILFAGKYMDPNG